MRRSLIATCLTLFLAITSSFSQPLPKTLLWRISGNGLTKPSYVYGTMHVNDPRLFILGDSLLNAISGSEGFANELDMNQITPMVTDMVKQDLIHAASVKDVLSKKAFDEYGPALAKKFKKPAEEITTTDILKEKNGWIHERIRGKSMQTFLDAYLTDLADRQGKWIGGIEDFSDQSGLVSSLVDESDIRQLVLSDGTGQKAEMENMTTIYLNGDLEGFQRIINGMDSSYKDKLLIRRNHKMAYRMDSLAHVRSLVFAVGAAHLPGDEGLIRLLKARGFNVEPVFSSKKIKPQDYSVHAVVRPWVEVNDPDGRYTVMMPGTPGDIRLYGLLSMKIYYNIFNGTLYMSYSMPIPYTGKDLDSVENSMLKQIFSGRDYKREKPLEINGVPGGSFIQKNAGGYKKVYLLSKENIIYFAMGFSTSETQTSLQAVNQFFDSYQPVHNQQDQNANGYAYVDSIHLYKVLLPAKPNLIENLQGGDKTLKSVIMISADPQTGTYFFCGSNDCKKGYVFRNDSTIMHNVHDNIVAKYSDVTLDTAYSKNNRRILEMEGSMMNGAMRAKTITTIRGNRYYSLLIMYAPGKWNEDMDKMQSSFHLMDYSAAHWARVSAPDSLFTTWAPAGFLYSDGKNNDEALQFLHYECFDSSRVHFYLMQIDTLNNYFWRKNDSVFWESEKNKYVTDLDTVLSEKIYTEDGLLQYDYLVRAKGGNNITRMHMWLRGNLIYLMSTVQEPETIGEENVNRFFDQFHFNRAVDKSHIFDSKAVLLLKDLRSADTIVSRKANNALPYAPFDATEIPLLQHAVLVSYPADNTLTNSTNGQIAEKIIGLNDSSSVAFARKHFVMTTDEEPKDGLMDILSAWRTRSNYDSLGKLLVASPPKYAIPNWVTNKWQDSLQVAASLFPTVLPLLKDSVLAPAIFNLADGLIKDSLISIEIFHPWQHAILQFAGQRFRKTKQDTLFYTDADYSVIYILQRMKTDSCNAMLKKWLAVESNAYHKQNIVLSLLKNNQEINSSVLQELAANENTRLELYLNLKEYKKTALFPEKYRTQSYFAGSLAREGAVRYSDQESDITFLHTKEMKWHGKMSRFFFYDLLLKDDNKHLLAVAGPFNINKANLSFSEADSDVFSEEYYDEKNAEKQMKALIAQLENKPADGD